MKQQPAWPEPPPPDEEGRRAKPFLKWVGGKRQLMGELDRLRPAKFGTFHEPFVGGGALFFHLGHAKAYLGDQNERLVRAYRGVRDDVDGVIARLKKYDWNHDKEQFLRVRTADVDAGDDADVAAWMIYLNKTGYNGLYRVNSRNIFNVPFGRYDDPTICDEPNLRACARALAGAQIAREDFAAVAGRAKKGDFVYFDPPYVPLSGTSNFASYTAGGFGLPEQERLRDVALELKRRGVHVLLSNSSAPEVLALYSEGFRIERVAAIRQVNSKATGRGAVAELLIR